jgi:hypothetical protein
MIEAMFLHRRCGKWSRALDINQPLENATVVELLRLLTSGHGSWVTTIRCIRLAAASDKVYQLLAHGLWLAPGTLASSTAKTNLAEALLKVALNIKQSIKSIYSVSRPLDLLGKGSTITSSKYIGELQRHYISNRIYISNCITNKEIIVMKYINECQ